MSIPGLTVPSRTHPVTAGQPTVVSAAQAAVVGFDVYGTLIDTQGVSEQLTELLADDVSAAAFASQWRTRQLEYSFRRGLMRRYVDFDTCIAQALDATAAVLGYRFDDTQRDSLLAAYQQLPAFPDAAPALERLREAGVVAYAFSNGAAKTVDALLSAAGLRDLLAGVISVEDVGSFKPDPGVYAHFLRTAKTSVDRAWLVSGNPFDVIGALSAGLRATWVRRTAVPFDPWGMEPTLTVATLSELMPDRLAQTA